MGGTVPVIRNVSALRAQVRCLAQAGETVALVPTMGALHAGHLELVRLAKARCSRAVVSIFVNPAQFAPHEDFDRYPRDEAGDLAKLAGVGCDLVWSPDRGEMYPEGFATRITPAGAAEGLESDFRPHFFGGVATVCCKLFTQVAPDVAVFGEKDYQQLAVVRQMVRDLDLPLEIVGLPTVREADGLAMSSRNAYLSPEQRRIAPDHLPRHHQSCRSRRAGRRDRRRPSPRARRTLGSRRLQGGLSRGARCRDPQARRARHPTPVARAGRRLARQDPPDRQHCGRSPLRLGFESNV